MRDEAVGEILVQPDDLSRRVRELGERISADYAGRELLLVGVLKGAVSFLPALMRHTRVPSGVVFMPVQRSDPWTDSDGFVSSASGSPRTTPAGSCCSSAC